MKKILTMALLGMIFTGAMAQQKSATVALKANSNTDLKIDKKSVEGSQSTEAVANFNAKGKKTKAKEQNNATTQNLKDNENALKQKNANTENSMGSELSNTNAVNDQKNNKGLSTTIESALAAEKTSSISNGLNSVTKIGNNSLVSTSSIASDLNSNIKLISADVKTNVKVITNIDIKPKLISTKLNILSGIKL